MSKEGLQKVIQQDQTDGPDTQVGPPKFFSPFNHWVSDGNQIRHISIFSSIVLFIFV